MEYIFEQFAQEIIFRKYALFTILNNNKAHGSRDLAKI